MSARKRKKSTSSNYLISTEKVSAKVKDEIIGKVRSNFFGTEFTLYDNGRNPNKLVGEDDIHLDTPRKELGAVVYVCHNPMQYSSFRIQIFLGSKDLGK
jgi:hypothetical protein